MRNTRLFPAFCASLIFAAPATAQQAQAPAPTPSRTADQIVCDLSGECGKQPNSDNSIAAPVQRGFEVYKPERRSAAKAGSTATQNMGRTTAAGVSRSQVARKVAHAATHASAAEPRRVDMRVSFLLNSAELTAQGQAEAKVFAEALQRPELATRHLRIAGHTDSSGTRAFNMDLSKRRAQAVADYLASLGIQSDRLDVRGYGPDRPLPGHRPNSPDNRRVEAQLL